MIRQYKEKDLNQCVSLLMTTYNGEPWNDHWEIETGTHYISEFVESKRAIGFVIEEDNQIIGACFCLAKTWMENTEFYINEFFISPDYQGQGLGSQLMNHVETYAKENQISHITLLTDRDMPAYDFYQKLNINEIKSNAFMCKRVL